MTAFTQEIDAAIEELRAWRADPPAGDQTGGSMYDAFESALRQVRDIDDARQIYERIAALNRFISDQGPLSPQFLPSLTRLFIRLHDQYAQRTA